LKKILTMLCGSLIVLLLFVGPGNVALAHDGDDCGCPTEITGVEKNKIVASFLASDGFKTKKAELLNSGYLWDGISTAQVVRFNPEIFPFFEGTGVAVAFITPSGETEIYFFVNEIFAGKM
jgi:hypothetical protein